MSTQSQITPIALTISDISVRQDSEGRYCLNDLHKASGGAAKHQPRYWLSNQQAKELIAELEKETSGIPLVKNLKGEIPPFENLTAGIPAVKKAEGRYGATYVAKELVYAYAMWISASFSLKVIRAYDALQSQPLEKVEQLPDDRLHVTPKELADLIDLRIKAIEGEVMSKASAQKYHAPKSDLHLTNHANLNAWLTYPQIKNQNCLAKLLRQLQDDGHDIEGAMVEFHGREFLLHSLHNKMDTLRNVLDALDNCGINIYQHQQQSKKHSAAQERTG